MNSISRPGILVQGAFHYNYKLTYGRLVCVWGGGGGGFKPLTHFHCVSHAKKQGRKAGGGGREGVQIAC